jgi:membrane protease YdiL (CAAX protease family)
MRLAMPNSMVESITNPEQQSLAHPTIGGSEFSEILSKNKFLQLLEIGIVFSPILVVIAAFRMMNIENPMVFVAAIWVANVTMLGLIWLGIRLRRESWTSVGLRFERPSIATVGWAILKSIPIFMFAIAAFILGSFVMANVVGIPDGADMTKYNYLRDNLPMLIVSLAGAYVVASFGEEVVYRGFLISRLQSLFGGESKTAVVAALIISSIIFGFAHFEWGPMGIGQTTFMGAALGISFLITKRNLWPLVLAHGYMDTLLFTQLYFAPESAG